MLRPTPVCQGPDRRRGRLLQGLVSPAQDPQSRTARGRSSLVFPARRRRKMAPLLDQPDLPACLPARIFHKDRRWDQGGRHMIGAIIFPTQHHVGGVIDTRERLMCRRMIMTIRIDAIAPVRAPASGYVDGSDPFDRAISIARRIQRSSSSVIHTSGGSTPPSGTCADPRRRALTAA